jgi:hypothetical protein
MPSFHRAPLYQTPPPPQPLEKAGALSFLPHVQVSSHHPCPAPLPFRQVPLKWYCRGAVASTEFFPLGGIVLYMHLKNGTFHRFIYG